MITVTYSFQIPSNESPTASAAVFCDSITRSTWTDLHRKSWQFSELAKPQLQDLAYRKELASGLLTVTAEFSFAAENLDPVAGGIPSLLNVIAGDIYELAGFCSTRLLDISFPEAYLNRFPGPRYGKEVASILTDRPKSIPLGVTIKPRLGLAPEECAELASMAAKGGAHFVKDDEIMFNPAYCPLTRRVQEVCQALKEVRRATKKEVPFFANVSGRPDKVRELAGQAIEAGARGLYVNALTSGFSSVRCLRETIEQPLIVGRDMYALLSRTGESGISLPVLGTLARMAGADMFFVGCVAGKLRNEIVETQSLVRALKQDRLAGMKATLPLVSCGVHPGNVHLNVALLGDEIAFQAGGGVHGHPEGTTDGTRAIREAIALAEQRIPLEDYMGNRGSKALSVALDKWNLFTLSENIRALAMVQFRGR